MILKGIKKEEYREHKEYWGKRFARIFGFKTMKQLDDYINECESAGRHLTLHAMFRNGYSKQSPYFITRVQLTIGTGKEEWGAEPGIKYYVLKILDKNKF